MVTIITKDSIRFHSHCFRGIGRYQVGDDHYQRFGRVGMPEWREMQELPPHVRKKEEEEEYNDDNNKKIIYKSEEKKNKK